MGEGENRTELKSITVIVLVGILAATYIIGVPVPACRPYVEPQIWLERDIYHVGESVRANVVLKNNMPFPVRVTLTEGIHCEMYMEEIPDEVSRIGSRNPRKTPEEIRIGLVQAAWHYLDGGPTTVTPGQLTFNFTVENMTIKKTVTIVE